MSSGFIRFSRDISKNGSNHDALDSLGTCDDLSVIVLLMQTLQYCVGMHPSGEPWNHRP